MCLTPAPSPTLSTHTSNNSIKMSSHPLSNAVVRGSTSTHRAPKRTDIQRSHLEEIRRLIDDCRSEGCTCGATELYAEPNRVARRRRHRGSNSPCMNVRPPFDIAIRCGSTDVRSNDTQRLDRPTDQSNEERFTGAGPSPRTQHHYQNLPPLQQDSLPHGLDILSSVALSVAAALQNESRTAGATAPAVGLGSLNGPTTAQALSDDPLTEKWNFELSRDHIVSVLTKDVPRECERSSQASTSRGVLNTQTRLSDLPPSQDAPQLAPRQENRWVGPSRKRKRDQLQGPSTATTGLDTLVSGRYDPDILVR